MVNGQVRKDACIGPLRVDIGAHACFVAKAISNRIFDFERCKVQTFQRAVLRGDVYFETLLRREPQLPRHIGGDVIQILFLTIGRVRQLDQHPLCQTAVQIQQQSIAP